MGRAADCLRHTEENFVGKVSEDDLKNYFRGIAATGAISKFGIPDKIIITDKIPKTSVGKLDKRNVEGGFAR